jgi:hypothetical protein
MALYTVAELDTATALLDGPKTVQELAGIVGADADVLGRILRLVASVGVFQLNGDTVEINDLGATLADGTDGSIRHTAVLDGNSLRALQRLAAHGAHWSASRRASPRRTVLRLDRGIPAPFRDPESAVAKPIAPCGC